MIQYVLWDNDGVLVDSEKLYFESNRRMLAIYGVTLTHEQFAEISLRQGQGVWRLVPHIDSRAFRAQRDALYDELLAAADDLVIDGVREVLKTVGVNRRMAIVSSSRPDHFATIHRSTDLLDKFEFALTNDCYAKVKPHPDGYIAALERFGAAPGQCVVVEDSPRGVAAAHAAGIRCVAIPSPFATAADWSLATAVLPTVRDFPDWLAAQN